MCLSDPQFVILCKEDSHIVKQPNIAKGGIVCNIARVCAISTQFIFLGHISAENNTHCSNLSDYYVTHCLTLSYMPSVIFQAAYVFHWLPTICVQVRLTGFEAGISQLKYSGLRWNGIKKIRANSVRGLTLSVFSFYIFCFDCIHGLTAFAGFFKTTFLCRQVAGWQGGHKGKPKPKPRECQKCFRKAWLLTVFIFSTTGLGAHWPLWGFKGI